MRIMYVMRIVIIGMKTISTLNQVLSGRYSFINSEGILMIEQKLITTRYGGVILFVTLFIVL